MKGPAGSFVAFWKEVLVDEEEEGSGLCFSGCLGSVSWVSVAFPKAVSWALEPRAALRRDRSEVPTGWRP